MNGIDKATTVKFDNSYVLLTNTDESGNLVGIQSIENLIIPDGSGLKISADGEITGDFTGGGELYLDSAVTLVIDGDCTGKTVLTLNPLLRFIKGDDENPYVVILGSEQYSGNSFYDNDSRYELQGGTSTNADYSGATMCYYIQADVYITDLVTVTSTSIKGRTYTDSIDDADTVYILNTGAISADIVLDYDFTESSKADNRYENVDREFVIKIDNTTFMELPIGTEIVMVYDGKYYSYTVSQDGTYSVPLSDFENISGTSFSEVTNIKEADGVSVDTSVLTNLSTYIYSESFRIVVNFSNCETRILANTYYPMINVNDDQDEDGDSDWIEDEQEDKASNVIIVEDRDYSYDGELNNSAYMKDGAINLSGTVTLSALSNVTIESDKDIYGIIKLLDDAGEEIEFPEGTVVSINGTNSTITNDYAKGIILEDITSSSMSQALEISVDMSHVLYQNGLDADSTYYLSLSMVSGTNGILESALLASFEYEFKIIDYSPLGLGIETDSALQLIAYGEGNPNEIDLSYTSIPENSHIEITVQKKEGAFTYETIDNLSAEGITLSESSISLSSTDGNENVTVTFGASTDTGTYRVVFTLIDQYGYEISETFESFIIY